MEWDGRLSGPQGIRSKGRPGCGQAPVPEAGDTSPLPFRISYCTADKMHDKVFAYIAQSQHNENLECHAFLCTKRKMVSWGRLGSGSGSLSLGALMQGRQDPKGVSVKSLKSLGTSSGCSAES